MEPTYCHSIKDSLLAFFGTEIQVTESMDGCVLVLPAKTVDDRYVAVFVEKKATDYFIVHDAGKTAAELHAQGVHITDLRTDTFANMADKLGASFAEGIFQVGCNREHLQSAILAISQCETMGMWHLLGHKPDTADEPISSYVERGLAAWNAPYQRRIEKNVRVQGNKARHLFEFVSYPLVETREPIAVKILKPSDDPIGKAREYGFLVYDTEKTYFEKWLRLAVLTRADRWSKPAKELVLSLSTAVIEIESGDETSVARRLPQELEAMAA